METLSLFADSGAMFAPIHSTPARRFFYRCCDCLSTVATESKLPEVYDDRRGQVTNAICDACGGRIEYLGATVGDTLRKFAGYTTPCDHRCTHAAGPNCECSCGGANHGSGVVVPVYYSGPVPRVGIAKRAGAKGEYYRELCGEFRAHWSRIFGGLASARERGEWLDVARFSELGRGRRLFSEFMHACGMRSYSARNASIKKLIAVLER